MAITKIMYMKAGKAGNVAAHLKHSLEYICNEAKTENRSLVGGINCLPDYAYEQMIGTKEMFGQVGGRQGYHFIISLKPGEGTTEQMYDIVQRFAEEFLGGEYEAVFAVHTDKDHLHSHLVFNSVNMINGRKYDYRKELYNEHARQKYQYEKGGDVTVYLYHEAHYREQLAELKEKRKEAKSELGTINRCLSESTYAHLEIPDDVDIENLYVVDVPEFESETISYPEYEAYEEKTVETESTVYGPAERTEPFVEPTDSLVSETITEPVSETVPLSEAFSEDTEGFAERVAEEVVEETYHPVNEPEMTKERYETLTDKEKVEWIGLEDCDVQERIHRFVSKMNSIGIVYKYSADMLDEFIRLEAVSKDKKSEQREEADIILQRDYENKGKSR